MTGTPPSSFEPATGLHGALAVEPPVPGERRRVANLIRWLAVFVAVPTVSIGLTLYAYDPVAHALHMVGFLILGAASFVVMAIAPRLAARWVPADA